MVIVISKNFFIRLKMTDYNYPNIKLKKNNFNKMSYIGSPKIIPRVHLSPKIKNVVRNHQYAKTSNGITKHVSPIRFPVSYSPNRLSPNRLSPNRLSPNRLSPNRLSPNRLSPNRLSPNRLSPNRLSPTRLSPSRIAKRIGKRSPMRKSPNRSKAFIAQKKSFRTNPSINPQTNRTIKKDGAVYNKLVKLYGKPY